MRSEATKFMVTGGAGFIGSHLCEFLLKEGHEVVCVDNLITGSRENIAPLESPSGIGGGRFQFIEHDVTRFIEVEGKLDYVLHFASPASPRDFARLPIQILKVGALGTHNALGLAKAKGATFLLASTSEIYGDPLITPQKENYWGNVNPIGPRGVYDEAKRFAEALTLAYHRIHRMDVRIARIFNTFGPRMRADDGRVVPNFITQAIRGEPLTVYGDGKQTRSFCYISDLIEGIRRLLEVKILQPVNLGSPQEVTIMELAQKICSLAGSKSEIVCRPLPEDDPRSRRPDIGRARKELGWEPKVSLEEGLRRTLQWLGECGTRN